MMGLQSKLMSEINLAQYMTEYNSKSIEINFLVMC